MFLKNFQKTRFIQFKKNHQNDVHVARNISKQSLT